MQKLTSEAVSRGHPDKLADQISDAVLDGCLAQDPGSRVACETLVTDGLIIVAGEISSTAQLDIRATVRKTIHDAGYDNPLFGFDSQGCGIAFSLHQQSSDVVQGIQKEQGAGDQGLMYGFACDETAELMPFPIWFAHRILNALDECRRQNIFPYLAPDAKSQVTVEYEGLIPKRIAAVVLSSQHTEDVELKQLRHDLKQMIIEIAPQGMLDDETLFYINSAGRFVIGGPRGDTGLTGRKIMVDSYGGIGRHGGGAFSGKDPTKVDRSAAYMARYLAKNIVAFKLAKRVEVGLAYAIGIAQPVDLHVETFGTGCMSDEELSTRVRLNFDLTPQGMIKKLDLLRPIYLKTAYGGHFGRSDPEFNWEQIADPLSLPFFN